MLDICGYFRVSSEDTALDKFAVNRYRSQLVDYGVEPENIFYDFASGGSADREDYQKMLNAIRSGNFKKVAVPIQSRLNRNVLESELLLKDLAAAGAKLIILESGQTIDPNNPNDKLNYRLNSLIDDRKLEDIKLANIQNAKYLREKKGVSRVPFGYTIERMKPKLDREDFLCLLVDKTHVSPADILLEVIELVIDSGNISRSIKAIHDKYGVPNHIPGQILRRAKKTKLHDFKSDRRLKNRRALHFTYQGLGCTLRNPLLHGDLNYFWRNKNRETIPNPDAYKHEAIISKSKFAKLQASIRTKKTKRIKGEDRDIFPFTGLVFCELCQAKFYSNRGGSRGNRKRTLYYYCKNKNKGCLSRNIKNDDIERAVIKKLIQKNQEIAQLAITQETIEDTPEIIQLEKQLQSLLKLPIQTPEINAIVEQTKSQITNTREQLKIGADVRQENIELLQSVFSNPLFFETLPSIDKRKIYHQLINKVTISLDIKDKEHPDFEKRKAIVERIDLLV